MRDSVKVSTVPAQMKMSAERRPGKQHVLQIEAYPTRAKKPLIPTSRGSV